jgi:CheY-like chemotaxis protein
MELLGAADLPSALDQITRHRPDFVFTGLEFGALHGPSLIAALKACPSHRSLPIAVVTPRDPRLLDLSLYRPDAVVGESTEYGPSILEFLDEYRVRDQTEMPGVPKARWVRFEGRILLIESSSMAQRIVGKMLHVAGANVTVVESVSEAMLVTVVQEFDIVLLDLESNEFVVNVGTRSSRLDLPSADPAELVRFLRAALPDTSVVGLASEDVDPELFGVDTILHKPVRRTHLFALCARLLRRNAAPTPGPRFRRIA